jgi:hypothetical protein
MRQGSADCRAKTQHRLAGLADQFADGVEHEEAQPFGPCAVQLLGQADAFEA